MNGNFPYFLCPNALCTSEVCAAVPDGGIGLFDQWQAQPDMVGAEFADGWLQALTVQLLNHAGGHPKPGRVPTGRGDSIALRYRVIRHCDVSLAVLGDGGRVVDRRLQGRPPGVRSSFHLTPESFIK